ncbi:MAG: glutathione S-transferase family protein [Gammaproteobacteria bacterium]|nr:glutathione S-transferase family protein [Gammaproteobacteria bacterium]
MARRHLITIPMSHYCEKARWALERLGLAYQEERHLQGFHYPRTYWVSRNPKVPVLIDAGKVIVDSSTILQHLEGYAQPPARLYPEKAAERRHVEALEDLFDETLGVESRRWFYFHYLPERRTALRIAGQGTPRIERAFAPLAYPIMRRFVVWRLQVSPSAVATGLERSRQIVRRTDTLLADGRPFLVGGRFSAADLTLACMMAPFVLPAEYGIRLPPVAELPAAMRPTVREFRETMTGEYVLRLFREHRRRVVVTAPIVTHH